MAKDRAVEFASFLFYDFWTYCPLLHSFKKRGICNKGDFFSNRQKVFYDDAAMWISGADDRWFFGNGLWYYFNYFFIGKWR